MEVHIVEVHIHHPLPPGWGWGWGWVLAAIKKPPLLGVLVVVVV